MFKDNEILARLDKIDSKLVQLQTVAVLNDKVDELLVEVGRLLKLWTDERAEVVEPSDFATVIEVEHWRAVTYKDCATDIEVSDAGRIRNKVTDNLLNSSPNPNKKPRVLFHYFEPDEEPRLTSALVENIVARAFINPLLSTHAKSVEHINGDVTDNRVDNLFVKGVTS